MPSLALKRSDSVLVVVDVQDKLYAAMPEGTRDRMVQNLCRLVEGALVLGVPVIATEQYPRGLGKTVHPLRELFSRFKEPPLLIEKLHFDACEDSTFENAMRSVNRSNILLGGMESHICVWQTARGFLERGATVHVATDATCSRSLENHKIAEELWRGAGAVVTSTETILFDLLHKAGTEEFKAISRLVR